MKASKEDALNDLRSLAHWVEGIGYCNGVSIRWLASRWLWGRSTTRTFLENCQAQGILRKQITSSGVDLIILKDNEKFKGGPTMKSSITVDCRVLIRIVSHIFGISDRQIEQCVTSNRGKRGRPSRPREDQKAFHVWIYALNCIAGHSSERVSTKTGLHRRAIQSAAASIENKRDQDILLNMQLDSIEAAYHAAIMGIQQEKSGAMA